MVRGIGLALVYAVAISPIRAAPSQEGQEASALLQKFLAHMQANGPITGTFTIETFHDEETLNARRR